MFYYFMPRYEGADLETSKFHPSLKPAVDWLLNVSAQERNLILTGDVGTGKTYLIHAYFNWVVRKYKLKVEENNDGIKYAEIRGIIFTSAKELVDVIRATWDRNDDWAYKYIDEIKKCTLLIIDEIGVQYGSESERIELHAILDERFEWKRKTIAITNLTDQECEKVIGKRNFSRLYGGALVVRAQGKDRRFE